MKRTISRYAIASTVALTTVLGACAKKGDVATTDSTVGTSMGAKVDTTASAGSVAPSNDWTDAQILGFASTADKGEIAEGKMARAKATSPAVKSFASQMVVDHAADLAAGKALATKLGITPDTTKKEVSDLIKSGDDDSKDLTDKKAGKDWDKEYLSKQVDDHQKVLSTLQDAQKSAKDPSLKDALTKSIATVQTHLDKAKALKDNDGNMQS